MTVSMSGKVRFCGYGDLTKSPLTGVKGIRRFDCSANPALLKVLNNLGVQNIVADSLAARALIKLNVAKVVKTIEHQPTDHIILNIATAAKVHTMLFYPRNSVGIKTAVFVAEPSNIRAMMPIKGRSMVLSVNSPFEPGLINEDIGTDKDKFKTVPLDRAFPKHVEKHPRVHDSERIVVMSVFEEFEINIPKGKY